MADLSKCPTMTISYANASSGNNDSFLMKDNVSFDTAQWLRDHLGYQTSENAVTYTVSSLFRPPRHVSKFKIHLVTLFPDCLWSVVCTGSIWECQHGDRHRSGPQKKRMDRH